MSITDVHIHLKKIPHKPSPIVIMCLLSYIINFINNEMSDDDDDDMYRQRHKRYAQANILVRKFYMCSDEVKIDLFRAYCTSFYTAPLWFKFKKESKLQVAYDDCMRILLKKQDGAVQVI